MLISDLATGPPAGVGGALGPFLAASTPRFSDFSRPVAAPAFQAMDTQLGPLGTRRLKMPGKGDGMARKWGADEPKMRLQLVICDSLTSDGFVRQPAIEPSPGPEPRLQNLEEQPAACRKNHKKTAKESEGRRGPPCTLQPGPARVDMRCGSGYSPAARRDREATIGLIPTP